MAHVQMVGTQGVPEPEPEQAGAQPTLVPLLPPWIPNCCEVPIYLVYSIPYLVVIIPCKLGLWVWPYIMPCVRAVCRWLVKNADYTKKLLRSFAFLSLLYATDMAWYLLFTKKVHDWELQWVDACCKLLAVVSMIIIIPFGYLVVELFRQWERAMLNNPDGWKRLPGFAINTLRCLCATCFGLASMYFGALIKENKIENQMWCSLLAFVLLMSMSVWSVDDFGAADSIIAIILGFIYSLEKGKKNLATHLALASCIPALRHYCIPLGNAIARWVKPADDAPVEKATSIHWFSPTAMKLFILAACVLGPYAFIPIVKNVHLDNYYVYIKH